MHQGKGPIRAEWTVPWLLPTGLSSFRQLGPVHEAPLKTAARVRSLRRTAFSICGNVNDDPSTV
jgi:hypothetical protein